MNLTERAKIAKEVYITQQTEQINKDFFELFQDTPDSVTITRLRKAEVKIGKATVKANRYEKWLGEGIPDETHWAFYDEDGWDSIKTMEELGFICE